MTTHVVSTKKRQQEMQHDQTKEDPDPGYPENRLNQKRNKEKRQDVAERDKKHSCRKHGSQPQVKHRRLAGLLTSKSTKRLHMPAHRAHQVEQLGGQALRRTCALAGTPRSNGGAVGVQQLLAAEDDAEKESDPDGDADRLQRIFTDVAFGLTLVGLGAG